MEKNRDWS